MLLRGALVIQTIQLILCNSILCLPGDHPWDYAYHFIANFSGIIVVYILLRRLPVIPTPSRKAAVLSSIFILTLLSILKEIEDNYIQISLDTPLDMTANILGMAVSTILIFATRIKSIRRL
jgi:hypothetical protein